MQFNDTSNLTGLIQECEDLCQTGVAGISGNTNLLKDFTRKINKWYGKIVVMILKVQDEWDFDDSNYTNFPILTNDLAVGQQDYSLPVGTLKIKRVEVSYDGITWKKAEPVDVNELGIATDTTTIASHFNRNEPYYDLQFGSVFIYPIPDVAVTGGIKIWVSREVDYFTSADTTQEPGFDETFHEMLSLGASYDYCKARKLAQTSALKNDLIEMEQRLNQYYADKQKDRNVSLRSAYKNME